MRSAMLDHALSRVDRHRQADTPQAAYFRLWGRGGLGSSPAGGGVTAPPPLSALTMPENHAQRPETARSMRRIFARYSLSFSLFLTKIRLFRVLSALFHPLQCRMYPVKDATQQRTVSMSTRPSA